MINMLKNMHISIIFKLVSTQRKRGKNQAGTIFNKVYAHITTFYQSTSFFLSVGVHLIKFHAKLMMTRWLLSMTGGHGARQWCTPQAYIIPEIASFVIIDLRRFVFFVAVVRSSKTIIIECAWCNEQKHYYHKLLPFCCSKCFINATTMKRKAILFHGK